MQMFLERGKGAVGGGLFFSQRVASRKPLYKMAAFSGGRARGDWHQVFTEAVPASSCCPAPARLRPSGVGVDPGTAGTASPGPVRPLLETEDLHWNQEITFWGKFRALYTTVQSYRIVCGR